MDFLANHIQALVFCSPKPITEEEIQDCLKEMFDADVPGDDIVSGLQSIEEKFKSEDFSMELDVA